MRLSTFGFPTACLAATLSCSNPTEPDPGPIVPDPFPNAHDVDLWIRATGLVLGAGDTFQQGFEVRDRASVRKNDPFSYPSRFDTIPSTYRIAWWSSDPRVLTVDSAGLMRAVAPGVAAMWVQVESERDSAVVRVGSGADPAGPRYRSVAAGSAHTCALAEAGEAYCWGSDFWGALGRGVRRWFRLGAAPERVVGGPVFQHLAVGSSHACGLVAGGDVWCWGKNFSGQLGNGERERDTEPAFAFEDDESVPVQVLGGIAFDTIVAQHQATCGLDQARTAYCWGSNFTWDLGIGSSDTGDARAEPTPVAGGHQFRLLGAGSSHACGVTADDETYCWGLHNWAAPPGPDQASFEPVLVATDLPFVDLAPGGAYTCGLTTLRETYCWGFNDDGQLGHADFDGSEMPTLLAGGFEFVALSAGGAHTCGLTATGGAFCWGANNYGQLGTGERDFTPNPDPMPVIGALSFSTLSAADSHTCGITPEGDAYCWGWMNSARLGNGRIQDFDAGETQVSVAPVRVVAPIL
jgi:alpha-tubulin suppressor-like RCC1 family protein